MKNIQRLIAVFFGWLSAALGILYVPVLLMVVCNVIDYVTGLLAAPNRGQGIDSYKGIRGITKKVTMWLLVVVGVIIDQLLQYAAATIGYKLPFDFLVACIVAIWIVCNEIISILENMIDIGIDMPVFLLPLIKNLQKTIDNAGEHIDSNNKTGDG